MLRLGYGVLFGLLTVQRMDIPSLPHQTEAWDAAYSSYVGYLMIDMLHSNAILKSFVEILQNEVRNRNSIDSNKEKCGKNARIRWFLAYTLINNEELRLNRAHAKRIGQKRELIAARMEAKLKIRVEKELKTKNTIEKIKLTFTKKSKIDNRGSVESNSMLEEDAKIIMKDIDATIEDEVDTAVIEQTRGRNLA